MAINPKDAIQKYYDEISPIIDKILEQGYGKQVVIRGNEARKLGYDWLDVREIGNGPIMDLIKTKYYDAGWTAVYVPSQLDSRLVFTPLDGRPFRKDGYN